MTVSFFDKSADGLFHLRWGSARISLLGNPLNSLVKLQFVLLDHSPNDLSWETQPHLSGEILSVYVQSVLVAVAGVRRRDHSTEFSAALASNFFDELFPRVPPIETLLHQHSKVVWEADFRCK